MRRMINLLPPSYRKQQIVRRRALQWSAAICVVLALGCVLHWFQLREHKALGQQLEALSREHRPTQNMLQQLVDMRKELEDLQQQELVARELEYQRNALTLLGVISETAHATNGRLRVTTLELTNFQLSRRLGGAEEAVELSGGLKLTGVALDNPAVAEFVDGLQDSGIFQRVELLGLKERDNESLRDYELHCEF